MSKRKQEYILKKAFTAKDTVAEFYTINGKKVICVYDRVLNGGDNPCVSYEDGTMMWYTDGILHRKNGPAIMNANTGKAEYYYQGVHMSKEEYEKKIAPPPETIETKEEVKEELE